MLRRGEATAQGGPDKKKQTPEEERRAAAVMRYIEKRILAGREELDPDELEEIKEYYAKMSPRENADTMYSKIQAIAMDRNIHNAENQENGSDEPFEPDQYLLNEIAVLLDDPATNLSTHRGYKLGTVVQAEAGHPSRRPKRQLTESPSWLLVTCCRPLLLRARTG